MSALPVNRSVSALVAFWYGDRNSIDRSIQASIVESFRDIETLDDYLNAYAHWNIVPALWDKNGNPVEAALLEDMLSLLAFPYRMRMDPSDPETIEWAQFFVPYFAGGTYEYRKRAEWKGVARLRKAGVPLEYARALDTPSWGQMMPVRRIVPLYRAGIAVEYTRTLLYGGEK